MSAPSSAAMSAATATPYGIPDCMKQNWLDAQKLNAQFATAKADDSYQGACFFITYESLLKSPIFPLFIVGRMPSVNLPFVQCIGVTSLSSIIIPIVVISTV